jgi:hypothetical protein
MSAPESHRKLALTTDAKADSVHELHLVTSKLAWFPSSTEPERT